MGDTIAGDTEDLRRRNLYSTLSDFERELGLGGEELVECDKKSESRST